MNINELCKIPKLSFISVYDKIGPGDTTLKIRELQKCDSLFCAVLSPVSRLFYGSKFSVCPNAAAFVTIDAAVGEVKDLEHHTFPEPAFLIDSILFPPADTVFFRRAKIFSFLLNTEEWLEEPDVFTFEFI